jgi:hypothetical protein
MGGGRAQVTVFLVTITHSVQQSLPNIALIKIL